MTTRYAGQARGLKFGASRSQIQERGEGRHGSCAAAGLSSKQGEHPTPLGSSELSQFWQSSQGFLKGPNWKEDTWPSTPPSNRKDMKSVSHDYVDSECNLKHFPVFDCIYLYRFSHPDAILRFSILSAIFTSQKEIFFFLLSLLN